MATAGYRGDTGAYQEHFDAKVGFVSEYGGISMSLLRKARRLPSPPKEQWDPGNHKQARWFGLPIDISAYSYLASSEYDSLFSMLYRSEHYVDRDIRSPREMVDATQIYQAFPTQIRHRVLPPQEVRSHHGRSVSGIFLRSVPAFASASWTLDRVPKVSYWWMKRAQARLAVSFAYKGRP